MHRRVGGLKVLCGLVLSGTLFVARVGAECSSPSPPGCSTNLLRNVGVEVSPAAVPNGSKATYTVDIVNIGAPANGCDVQKAFVIFCCPGADGNPVPGPVGCTNVPVTTSPCIVNDGATCVATAEATTGIDLPADGSNNKTVVGLQCLINVDPGVTTALAEAIVKEGYLSCQSPSPPGVPEPALGNIVSVKVMGSGPTPTVTPTLTPTTTATRTPTETPTSCVSDPPSLIPPTSPTSLLTQTLTGFSHGLFCFRGGSLSVHGIPVLMQTVDCQNGSFSVTVQLTPNTTNRFDVCLVPGFCGTGGCAHVAIDQVSATLTPSATPTSTRTTTPVPSNTPTPTAMRTPTLTATGGTPSPSPFDEAGGCQINTTGGSGAGWLLLVPAIGLLLLGGRR